VGNNVIIVSFSVGKHPDGGLYSKGPSYSGYSGYIMMPNMNNDPYMPNGSLSPPIPRTVSYLFRRPVLASWVSSCSVCSARSRRGVFGWPQWRRRLRFCCSEPPSSGVWELWEVSVAIAVEKLRLTAAVSDVLWTGLGAGAGEPWFTTVG